MFYIKFLLKMGLYIDKPLKNYQYGFYTYDNLHNFIKLKMLKFIKQNGSCQSSSLANNLLLFLVDYSNQFHIFVGCDLC